MTGDRQENKILVTGGVNYSNKKFLIRNVEEYNIKSNKWKNLKSMKN